MDELMADEIDEPCTNKDVMSVVKGKKITKLEKKFKAETMAGKKKNLILVLSMSLNFYFLLKFYIL
jgi:hypothetical protein